MPRAPRTPRTPLSMPRTPEWGGGEEEWADARPPVRSHEPPRVWTLPLVPFDEDEDEVEVNAPTEQKQEEEEEEEEEAASPPPTGLSKAERTLVRAAAHIQALVRGRRVRGLNGAELWSLARFTAVEHERAALQLRHVIPADWRLAPKERQLVETAADRFDEDYQLRVGKASRCIQRLNGRDGMRAERRLEQRLLDVSSTRFSVQPRCELDWLAKNFKVYAAGERREKVVEEALFELEETIWRQRKKWTDCKDYLDTADGLTQAINADWDKARHGGGLDRVVMRASAGGDEGADVLMAAVRDAFVANAEAVYALFDTATCFGSGGDFSHISSNGYKELLNCCGLIEHKADGLNGARWDEL